MTKQNPLPETKQKIVSAPRIRLASLSAALPAQKPRAILPEINLDTPSVPAETKPVTKEYFGTLFAWSVEEKIPSEEERKGRNIIIMGGAGVIALAALFWGNYLLVIFIALAAFVLYAGAGRKPGAVKCAITPRGIKIENRVYEFSDLKSFWLFYEPPEIKELSLESRKTAMPYIKVPLGDTDPVKLREMLMKFIPEKKHEESLTDIIGRKFFG